MERSRAGRPDGETQDSLPARPPASLHSELLHKCEPWSRYHEASPARAPTWGQVFGKASRQHRWRTARALALPRAQGEGTLGSSRVTEPQFCPENWGDQDLLPQLFFSPGLSEDAPGGRGRHRGSSGLGGARAVTVGLQSFESENPTQAGCGQKGAFFKRPQGGPPDCPPGLAGGVRSIPWPVPVSSCHCPSPGGHHFCNIYRYKVAVKLT